MNKKHYFAAGVVFIFAMVMASTGLAWAQKKGIDPSYHDYISEYNKGDHNAAYYVGIAFYHGFFKAPHDLEKALEWFLKAADKGNPEACLKLGDMYSYGRGVTINKQNAMQWYRKAAEKDNAEGQEKLGDMYYYGEVVQRNYPEAAKWYKKASEQEVGPGPCSKLGTMYLLGDGVALDYPEALYWYLKAYELGDINATVFISEIYRSEDDLPEAILWLQKGASHGNTLAMQDLAEAYVSWKGVKQNYIEAYKWLSVVIARENDTSAESLFKKISESMSREELLTARKLASEAVEKYVTLQDKETKEYMKTLKGN